MGAYQAIDADDVVWHWIPPGHDERYPTSVWLPLDNGHQLGTQGQDNLPIPAVAAPGDFGAVTREWEAAGHHGKAPPPTLPLGTSLRKFPAPPVQDPGEETLAAAHSSQDAFGEPCLGKMPLARVGDPAGMHGLGIAAPIPDGPRHPQHASPQLAAKAIAPGCAPMEHGGLPPAGALLAPMQDNPAPGGHPGPALGGDHAGGVGEAPPRDTGARNRSTSWNRTLRRAFESAAARLFETLGPGAALTLISTCHQCLRTP